MYIIMRTETFAKLFFLVCFSGLVMYIMLAFYTFHTGYSTVYDYENYDTIAPLKPLNLGNKEFKNDDDLKFILVWTTPSFQENSFGEGQKPFVDNNCSYINCYLTTNKDLLNGYHIDFDVVVMDVKILRSSLWMNIMPPTRNLRQKYLFHSMASADDMPVCNVKADNFFNWTWTYKIESDIFTPFIEVKDFSGHVIAPRNDVRWIEKNNTITEELQNKLVQKKRAVAWMPKTCVTRANRLEFVKELQNALKEHNMELDIFGCHFQNCPIQGCADILEQDYYFYLAFENSIAEDYVTQDVLNAYHHNTVPIVKGGANYKNFLPEGSYIDGSKLNVQQLASTIAHSIKNPATYNKYHEWRNHYTINRKNHDEGLCELCAMLNDKGKMAKRTSYEKFRSWWYNNLQDRCYPKGAEDMSAVISYVNDTKRG